MSDNQHTPGPWKWKGEAGPGCSSWDVGDLINNNGLVVFHHEIDNSTADEYGFGLTTQANARLIAAAPDLLAACEKSEELLSVLCEVLCANNPPPHGTETIAVLRAAIAKATGEPT